MKEDKYKQEHGNFSEYSSQSGSLGTTRSQEEFNTTSSVDITSILAIEELGDVEAGDVHKHLEETQASSDKQPIVESRDREEELKVKRSNQLSRHDIIEEPGAEFFTNVNTKNNNYLINLREDDDPALDPLSSQQQIASKNNFGDDNLIKDDDLFKVPDDNSEGSSRAADDFEYVDREASIISPALTDPTGEWSGFFTTDSVPIAKEVEDKTEDNFISETTAVATKVSPQSKPPFYKNRRFHFYYILTFAILFLGICCIIVWATLPTQEPGITPVTLAPATNLVESPVSEETSDMLDQFMQLVGEANLAVDGSPYQNAASWVIDKDPLQLSPKAGNLAQRFILALFYFSTSARRPWRSCNPPAENETAVCMFDQIVAVNPVRKYVPVPKVRWLTERSECEWAGVKCDNNGQVVRLSIMGQDILSTLPSSIMLLPSLQVISFSVNEFYGTLPKELADLRRIINVELQYNMFTGHIPSEWWRSTSPRMLNLERNLLSGSIPTEVGLLTEMQNLYLSENNISGKIPTEIGNAKNLIFLRWSQNYLTGTIPSEVGKLTSLKEMWFLKNELTGALPSELGSISAIQSLRLNHNSFHGTIPEEHYAMINLDKWDIYDCNFTGTISTKIGNLAKLEKYRIRRNNFHGTIPSELGGLGSLSSVWMHENNFSKPIPRELCRLNIDIFMDCDLNDEGPLNECYFDCCVDSGTPRAACFDR
mmetsp:Transcript_10401/g.15304  ORF Transcript_10401/g.15304 Transcript_10401/m.15304 type:complete len:710 (-) Transcript_10401:57-2186(-)